MPAHGSFETAFEQGIASLKTAPLWQRVPQTEQAEILAALDLVPVEPLDLSSDSALLSALDARLLSARNAELHAIPGRLQKALEHTARLLEPKVRPVAIERSTLTTEADVDAWLERQNKALLAAIKDGPVLVS